MLAGRIAEFRGAKICHLEFHRDSALLLVVLQRTGHERQICGKIRRQLLDILLLHPAVQHFFLQRNVNLFVRIARSLTLVVKGPHECVGEEDPGKALGIEIVGHHRPIGNAAFDIQLVEDVGKIRVAAGFLEFGFLLHQPLGVLG